MITLNYEPSGYQSAHSPLWYEVQSNNSGQDEFRYVFDLYVNGSFITRQKLFPDPTDDKGYIDVSPVVRSYFNFETEIVDTGNENFVTEWGLGEFYVGFHAVIGEEYSGTPYVSGDVTGASLSAYNQTKRKQLFNNDTLPNFFEKFMSNRPTYSTAYRTQPLIIGAWPISEANSYIVVQTHYNYSTSLGSASTLNFTGTTPRHGDVSPANFLSFDNVTRVKMDLQRDDLSTNIVDTKYFDIQCNPRYTPVTLMFLNRLGCWDSFTFGLRNVVSIDATRKEFIQNPYVGRSNTIGSDFLRESKKVFSTEYKTKWQLRSDSLTKDEYIWLEELITSPMVYVYVPEADVIWQPVQVSETNYRIVDHTIEKENTLEINIEFSETNHAQYR